MHGEDTPVSGRWYKGRCQFDNVRLWQVPGGDKPDGEEYACFPGKGVVVLHARHEHGIRA